MNMLDACQDVLHACSCLPGRRRRSPDHLPQVRAPVLVYKVCHTLDRETVQQADDPRMTGHVRDHGFLAADPSNTRSTMSEQWP
jgi:hypothetical protein